MVVEKKEVKSKNITKVEIIVAEMITIYKNRLHDYSDINLIEIN